MRLSWASTHLVNSTCAGWLGGKAREYRNIQRKTVMSRPNTTLEPNVPAAAAVDLKLRSRRHPGFRRRTRQALLRRPGLEARRRLCCRGHVSGGSVHAAGLAELGPLRQGRHVGCAGLGTGALPHRVRHRGGARRARRPRCRRERRYSTEPAQESRRSAGATQSGAATSRMPPSQIPTATTGCYKRSPLDCPGGGRGRNDVHVVG